MVYLGLEPGAAGCKAQTNSLSFGTTKILFCLNTECLDRNYVKQVCSKELSGFVCTYNPATPGLSSKHTI